MSTMQRNSNKAALYTPSFFDERNTSNAAYHADFSAVFAEATSHAEKNSIKGSASDRVKTSLLLIDLQNDFCQKSGNLYVGGQSGEGAIDDNNRIAEFIYGNLERITNIRYTLDSHIPFQIFFPSFWVDQNGKNLQPFDLVKLKAGKLVIVRMGTDAGVASVSPKAAGAIGVHSMPFMNSYAKHYVKTLEDKGRLDLTIWPYHCLIGTPGHNLVGTIDEARLFHSFARSIQSEPSIKGGNPLTENYGVFACEVDTRQDGAPIAHKNIQLLKELVENDQIIIAGQAWSHCVASSISQLLDDILSKDKSLAKKVYLMADCTSAVTVPDGKGGFIVDYTSHAENAFKKFESAGMNLVESTTPLHQWPGFKL
jgi:nicotinamidase-related amidase